MKSDKELYRDLRAMAWNRLWKDEVPRFNRAGAAERMAGVAVIRAVGVVFSESGPARQKEEVKEWLVGLLGDPAEKIRRYAMAALPKIGVGAQEEAELLALLQRTTLEREKKFLGAALHKIGGEATLAVAAELLPQSAQKVKAGVARVQSPSTIRLDEELADFAGLRLHLRGRAGLEQIVAEEASEAGRAHGKFRVEETGRGVVTLVALAPFSLGDIYALRCFGTVGFVLGRAQGASEAETLERAAEVIVSPRARKIFATFTEGSRRYRLDFVGKGHQRGAVRVVAERAFALDPDILNDARSAPWTVQIRSDAAGDLVELSPKLSPDPRLFFRQGDVPASSHPPLAACMARLAGTGKDETVWDPFCGSGLELIECAMRGGVRQVLGTDVSAEAVEIARGNFAAARLPETKAKFVGADFRDFARTMRPGAVTLIITNPPMGKRVPIPNLPGLIAELFAAAERVLAPGGRLVFANPLTVRPRGPGLRLESRRTVDFGGFDCEVEVWRKG